jgi:phage terminase small subunit
VAKKLKEQRFVEEYLKDLNATQAYLRSHPGASANTARTEGSRLLAKPDIKKLIDEATTQRSKRINISQDEILAELWRVAFADATYFDEWGKLADKLKALELLGRHVGIFNDKLEVWLKKMTDEELARIVEDRLENKTAG